MSKNLPTIYRKCKLCGYENQNDEGFMYLGDSVWSCVYCSSKYTYISKVEEDDDEI